MELTATNKKWAISHAGVRIEYDAHLPIDELKQIIEIMLKCLDKEAERTAIIPNVNQI